MQPNSDCQKLKQGFYNVPQEAKMRAWWFWMNGIATKKSSAQNLEAMKDMGIAGALLIDNGGNYASMQLQKNLMWCAKRLSGLTKSSLHRVLLSHSLEKDFGNDIVFWGGGVDTQDILPNATPEKLKDHVKRNIDALAPGGDFVFSTVYNILAEVPPENIAAMLETLKDFGKY